MELRFTGIILFMVLRTVSGQNSLPIDPSIALPPTVSSVLPSDPRQILNRRTQDITNQLASQFSFCIIDGQKDRDLAFNYPAYSEIFSSCPGNDFALRLCSEAEVRFYFSNIRDARNLPPNKNCNGSSWSLGCEPGWASTTPSDSSSSSSSIANIPSRILNAQPCCPGFFCPRGLTCMIPCPLGAYCPTATFNEVTNKCEPFGYRMTPKIGGECGGADVWADVDSAGEVFCEPGSFCPTPVLSNNCSKGSYCREGSTAEKKCYKFTSCKENAHKQNLRLYGILFVVVLAMLLVVMYSCSDQVMTFRERRKSKARENAARQAREHVSALEKWRQTKERAKKRAKNLSGQFSRTFSRKRIKNAEEMQELSPSTVKSDDLPVVVESMEQGFDRIVVAHAVSGLYNSLPAPPIAYVAEHPPSKIRTGDTESQIFKYAYGQIEREKAIKFTDIQLERVGSVFDGSRVRPRIELAFEDLTMILKKSGKKILANVTGKLLPGNVTAIMGPSGAGKTTFLNAVAGKATTGCRTLGKIHINGKPGSIRSYRKIIGFVPQDDIVHGNLTVEENLAFSAKYRLSVDLPKRERVLVIERIIASLGLGAIRDSIVGTVEKRGISGGQRKRVNVGLEMVMEPSLLILDEPTSGLDSTSSRLVLQALRREALVGVNVVVVLHQPSYSLFRMFDDVMFLAKGGRTVYLGAVEEVEAYFKVLGVTVPARINPPDHFMDVLEGIVTPDDNPSFDPSLLPIIWMQRQGHKIPEDLKDAALALETMDLASAVDAVGNKMKMMDKSKTFREEAWEELKEPVLLCWESLTIALVKVQDSSGRTTLGFFSQYKLILRRVAKQRFREARLLCQDYIILFLAGICVGQLSNIKDETLGANGYTYSIIALSLLCMVSALRTFSSDKLQFWRESASGVNRVAYFMAKDTVDHFNSLVKPLVYLSMFYFFNDPRSTFASNYIITLALFYCVTGIAYIFAILLQPSTAQLCCVFLPVVSTLIATQRGWDGVLAMVIKASYARWALEAYVVENAKRYYGVWLITRCGILERLGYDLNNYKKCVGVLIGYGIGSRVVALLSLMFSNRRKQK